MTAKNSPPGGGRAAHAGCVVGNKAFIYGGYDGKKRLSDVYFLNTGTRS